MPVHTDSRFEHVKCCCKICSRILTAEQKEWRLSVATNMLQEAVSDENVMGQIITGDETWVYAYDPETKNQSSQWKSADSQRPKKARQVLSKVKDLLIVFFDMEGIVHYEYVPQDQTVNQQLYLQVLKRLRLAVSRKKLAAGPGHYITTMHQHTQHIPSRYYWQVMAFLSFSNHPTPPTWLRVTFGCSPN